MSFRLPTILPALLLGLLCIGSSESARADDQGLILESYVGARPRDADYLLAPLVDELKRIGFRGSSVTGTRIHSLHSLSSEELSARQIKDARAAVKEGHAAYVDLHFEGAIDAATRGLDLLMSRPATMARQQDVRDYFYEALITISMASQRLNARSGFEEAMREFIRSFPDRDLSHKKYGPEGAELYRKIKETMSEEKKGVLQIAAGPGSTIFINERYVGLGSLTASLFPGRYRIFTQNGEQAGRVHVVEVQADRKQTLVVDSVVDRSLRTGNGMVGFVFESEDERSEHERRVTLDLGKAVGAETIILVGFHKFKGEDSVVASSVSIGTGESGPSARVPLPRNGAPSATQLRALASFVAGAGPATPDIEVLTVSPSIIARDDAPKRDASGRAIELHGIAGTASGGISSAWRWSSWGLGAAGIGVGAYLLSLDGAGTCTLQPGQVLCPENFETQTPGIALIAGGTAMGLLGFYLWTHEDDEGARRLSMTPTSDGMYARLSGTF